MERKQNARAAGFDWGLPWPPGGLASSDERRRLSLQPGKPVVGFFLRGKSGECCVGLGHY